MSSYTIRTRSPEMPQLNIREVLRYALCHDKGAELAPTVEACFEEASGHLSGRAVTCEVPVRVEESEVFFPFCATHSHSLAKNLEGCDRAIILAATVGLGIDRLVAKYGALSPSRALILQGLGAERIEALCDALTEELSREYAAAGYALRPRFSPGYGDFALSHQRDIISFLDTPRKLGVTLNAGLLMSPTKSVTAIIGLRRQK